MSRIDRLEPVFVEFIPPERELEPGKLYVSMIYATTTHLCASGCGMKVVLPLSPAKWHLKFDGDSISISPSVGNWDYPCRSHYWIRENKIIWAGQWDEKRVAAGRRNDQQDVDEYFTEKPKKQAPVKKGFWDRLFGK